MSGRMSRRNLGSMRRESPTQMAVNIDREARALQNLLIDTAWRPGRIKAP